MFQRLLEIFRRPRQVPGEPPWPNLAGDRDLEWGYVKRHLGRYAKPGKYALDVGCGTGALTFEALRRHLSVVAVDHGKIQFVVPTESPLEYIEGNVLDMPDGGRRFDIIINCSTIEHSGLPGRYSDWDAPDGDLQVMEKLRNLMAPQGVMLLTLPVGRDAVILPLHRIYGPSRLPQLLRGFDVEEDEYWRKDNRNRWIRASRQDALAVEGNDHYYAIGCLVLGAGPRMGGKV